MEAISGLSSLFNLSTDTFSELYKLPAPLQHQLSIIIYAFVNAFLICNEEYKDISDADIEFLLSQSVIHHFYTSSDTYSDEKYLEKGFSIMKKIESKRIINAFIYLLNVIRKTLPVLEEMELNRTIKIPPFIAIGGIENDSYYSDYYIIIDFGGNNTYMNNAGGTRIVYPNGEIKYKGVALCIDLDGNDLYLPNINANGQFCQAQGVGIAILMDVKGNDNYFSKGVSQATATLGCSLLADLAGNDYYEVSGSEAYEGGESQGYGEWGGIGILYDEKGNDEYTGKDCCQASAMLWGAGFLIDKEGNDKYNCENLGQAAGGLMGYTLLLDFSGDDVYLANGTSQA